MLDLSHNELTFQAVEANAILSLLKTYGINKAARLDNVSGRLLKCVADVLTILITQICNLSIKNISLYDRL